MSKSKNIDLDIHIDEDTSENEYENIDSITEGNVLKNDDETDIIDGGDDDDDEYDDDDDDNEDEYYDEDDKINNINETSEKIKDIKSIADDNNDEDDDDIFDYINPEDEINKDMRIPDNERTTIPILTKYEKVRLLGTRAKQIADGSKRFVISKNVRDHMDIAELELQYKVIPLKIKRPMPNGKYEIRSIKDLEIID